MEQEAQDPVAVTLLRLQKLEAVGRIAGGFAHDIGNLLTAIRLNLDAIAGKLHDEALETRVHDAIAGAECGMKAVQSLLAFTRLGKFSSERIDAAAAIRSAAAMMRQALGERSRLDLDLSGSSWPVEVDANQLQLALVNLALNARDAMPQGGRLRVAVADVRLAGTPDGLTGDFVAVTVGDTGIGMPPEILARARQPYFSTKPDGTGLGLSQVDSFAVEFGGGVAMASEVGRGTTITILLPRAAAKKRQTIDGWTVARGRAESEAGLPWAVAASRRDRSRKSRGGRAPVWQVTIADHVLPNSRSPSGGVRRGT